MEQEQEVKIESSENKNMTPYAIGAVVIVVAVAGVFFLSKGNSTSTVKPSPKANTTQQAVMGDETALPSDAKKSPTASDAGQTAESGVKTIEIEAGSFYYKPNEIRVKKGEKVKVVIKSVSMMHDFVVEGLDVKSAIVKSGETGSVEFTASKAGTFEFYCSVGQHRQNGQVGTLIVE